jgi:hypothetical protein
MAALIGALRVSLSADTANFEAGMRRAQATSKNAAGAISQSLGGLKGLVTGFVSALSVGTFVNVIKNALEYAGSLQEVASQVGVTAKELQTLRYAAAQNGISTDQLETAMTKLSISIGKANAGSKQAQTAFKAVGVELGDLQSKSKSEILGQIADGMVKTGGAAKNAAAGVAIMGKGFMTMAPLLDQGSAGINALSAAAEKLGIVLSDEQIQRADDTADKIDALKTVLSANIASEVADNADAILTLANALATLVRTIPDAINGWRILAAEYRAAAPYLAMGIAGVGMGVQAADQAAIVERRRQKLAALPLLPVELTRKPPPPPAGDISRFLASPGPKPKKAKEGHTAENQLRDQYEFAQDERRAQMDILRAKQDLATDYIQRTALSIEMLNAEKDDHEAELQYKVALNKLTKGKEGLTEAQAEQLRAAYDIKDSLERDKVLQDEHEQQQRDIQELTQHDFDRRRDALESQADIATTASERRKIELQLLDLAYEQKRQALQNTIDTSKDYKAVEDARRDLLVLNHTYANDRGGVMQRTRGPLEEWAASVPQSAAQINEALQSIEVQGLDGLAEAITGVITGTEKLKDAFGNLARSIISDIIQMTVKMLIFRAVSSIMGIPSGGGSGFNIGSGLDFGNSFSAITNAPKFATGGSFRVFGGKGVDGIPLSAGGIHIADVNHGERISIANDNAGGVPQRVIVELRDDMLDARIADGADVQIVRRYPAMKADTMRSIGERQRRA